MPSTQTNCTHQGSGLIVVMDDEPTIGRLLERILGGAGYTVSIFPDGVGALDALRRGGFPVEPRCVFLDLTVPGGMGGLEAGREILRLWPDLPLIATSGYSSDPVMARPHDFGFRYSLSKPFRRVEVLALMERIFPGNDSGALPS